MIQVLNQYIPYTYNQLLLYCFSPKNNSPMKGKRPALITGQCKYFLTLIIVGNMLTIIHQVFPEIQQ